jgi:hypothetical protein
MCDSVLATHCTGASSKRELAHVALHTGTSPLHVCVSIAVSHSAALNAHNAHSNIPLFVDTATAAVTGC